VMDERDGAYLYGWAGDAWETCGEESESRERELRAQPPSTARGRRNEVVAAAWSNSILVPRVR
jgi:hypothetical protein